MFTYPLALRSIGFSAGPMNAGFFGPRLSGRYTIVFLVRVLSGVCNHMQEKIDIDAFRVLGLVVRGNSMVC